GGLFKICERDGKVTGAIAFMPEAESVVSLVSALIRLEVSLKDALNLILPHPSYLEVLSESLRVLK
ncbi:pyridine nucleotide-disulfide oxidoreductase, partial [Sulfolobus sp. A20-N-F8]